MPQRRMQCVTLLAVCVAFSWTGSAGAETWRLKDGQTWEPSTAGPDEQFLHAIAEIKKLVQEGEAKAAKEIVKQLKEEFPDRVSQDLDLFVDGELRYWKNRYGKALVKYERLLKNYPGSEFADAAVQREYDIAQAYLQGRKKVILGFIRISGYSEGVEIMEKVSDRAGIDEPNSVGLNAAIAVAEHYERTEQYLEGYLKWSEIASYWETGPIGKRAIYRMAEDNFLAYNRNDPKYRYRFDASKLSTAKTYYERFLALYPDEAAANDVPAKIKEIDEEIAFKQFKIGQYYRRVGKDRAAYLYFDMVIRSWPKTEAAGMAKQVIAETSKGEEASGK
jgi:outer membrane protein assembly factor BamD (BamD/ComL family)